MLRTHLRNLVVCAIAGTVIAGVACESSSPRKKPTQTGAAGTGAQTQGGAGTTGAAGDTGVAGTTGAAGDTGVAGTTGAAGDTGVAGTTGAAGDTGVAGTTGAAGTGAPVDNTPTVALPITVTDKWYPSGWVADPYTMGLFASTDPLTKPITIEDQTGAATGPCSTRVAGAVGQCWKVTYNPQVDADGGAPGFAAVVLLSGQSNWDNSLAAPRPAQGATKISAQVRGEAGGEAVTFTFGAAGDGFQTKVPTTLTNAWQEVALPMNGVPYDHVLSPFAWESASTTKIVFYYDDVVIK
jgi:hypothetical protein